MAFMTLPTNFHCKNFQKHKQIRLGLCCYASLTWETTSLWTRNTDEGIVNEGKMRQFKVTICLSQNGQNDGGGNVYIEANYVCERAGWKGERKGEVRLAGGVGEGRSRKA